MSDKNRVEILVKNQSDYDFLSKHADYCSSLTGVCVFTTKEAKILLAQHPKLMKKYIDEDKFLKEKTEVVCSASLTNKNVIQLHNADSFILSFLEIFNSYDPVVKIGNYSRFFTLVEHDIIKLDEDFLKKMTYWDLDMKLSELISYTPKIRFRGKFFSLSSNFKEGTGIDIGLNNVIPIKKRIIRLENALVTQEFEKVDNSNAHIAKIKDSNDKEYEVKVFFLTPNLKQVFHKNKCINVAADKIYGSVDTTLTINNPIILPKGLDIKYLDKLNAPRTIPIAIMSAAYYEYMFRKEQLKPKKGKK